MDIIYYFSKFCSRSSSNLRKAKIQISHWCKSYKNYKYTNLLKNRHTINKAIKFKQNYKNKHKCPRQETFYILG